MHNKLIDISEASQRLGVTIATLRRWDTSGKLKSVRTFGNHRRYRLEEIEALVNPTVDVPLTQKWPLFIVEFPLKNNKKVAIFNNNETV